MIKMPKRIKMIVWFQNMLKLKAMERTWFNTNTMNQLMLVMARMNKRTTTFSLKFFKMFIFGNGETWCPENRRCEEFISLTKCVKNNKITCWKFYDSHC
jgi:hypothetical protein